MEEAKTINIYPLVEAERIMRKIYALTGDIRFTAKIQSEVIRSFLLLSSIIQDTLEEHMTLEDIFDDLPVRNPMPAPFKAREDVVEIDRVARDTLAKLNTSPSLFPAGVSEIIQELINKVGESLA